MLPNPEEIRTALKDVGHEIRCGWHRFRIVRLQRKIERRKLKEMNLRIKGWAR